MNELDPSTQKIDRATETITDISEQANQPAFNITIKAARAGDVSKGFVVVASGIKELARQTNTSAVRIKRPD